MNELKHQTLQVGQRVYSGLYGGRYGVIFAIHGEQAPQTIRKHLSVISSGGNADIDVVFENGTKSLRIPECIVRGAQWKIYPDVASQKVIDLMLAAVERKKNVDAYKADQARQKFAEESARLQKLHKDLIRVEDSDKPARVVAATNIRKQLKQAFPKIKFSVTTKSYSDGDSIRVEWIDGPTTEQVRAITENYVGSSFDGMQDLKSYVKTPFNSLFGDSDHVFCERDYSDIAVQSAIDEIYEERGTADGVRPTYEDYRRGELWQIKDKWNCSDYSDLVRRKLSETVFS